MCGRFTHALTWRELVALYRLNQAGPPAGWTARYNLAPSQLAPIVRIGRQSGVRELAMLKWGLVPHWAKDPATGYSTINARAETVAVKPAFREAFKHRRCLVPASGYFEWRAEGRGPKQPYHLTRADGAPMSFAGLWENWMPINGGPALETFTIIVGPANDQARPYHERMPAILEDADEFEAWLDPETPAEQLQALLRPYAGELEVRPVSRAVNSPTNDGPELLAG
jgi:putative SOS response-associated peptidase YedK